MIGFTAYFAEVLSMIFSKPMPHVFKELFSNILISTTWKGEDINFVLYKADDITKEEFEKVLLENEFTYVLDYEDEYVYNYNISWKL